MGAIDRIRRRLAERRASAPRAAAQPPAPAPTAAEEARLWASLRDDPNDQESFHALARIVRLRAEEGHESGDPRKAADDAVWSLAEELAHSPRAWYPLIELGRLSVHDDREQALKRFATASDRDPTGCALATAVRTLREEGLPSDGLGLGVGHWRPREHVVEAGQQLVHAAVDAGRPSEARRFLESLSSHPDTAAAEKSRVELLRVVEEAERNRAAAGPASGSLPVVDVRERKLFKR